MLMNRRLYRSRTDTILGGVAAGLANYLKTDPALVRIAWAILVPLTGGAAFLAYIVGWIVIPEEPRRAERPAGSEAAAADDEPEFVVPAGSLDEDRAGGESRAGLVVGIGLVLIGLWFLAREYLPAIDWGLIWPIVIVGIGVLILVNSARR